MNIQLSEHFGYKKLIRFALPSVIMMIFSSIYSVVDGFFVSNFVGITPFAAINLVFPFTQMIACIGFMFGSGGSALVSMKRGEGKDEEANRIFSMLVYVGFAAGAVLAALGFIFMERISLLMGADENMLPYCITYGRILCVALPVFILQNMFQSFMVTAEKPRMGLAVTVIAGVTNMALDALFIIPLKFGLTGAAAATAISQCVGGVIPLIYFFTNKKGVLRLGRASIRGKTLIGVCANGSSEFVTNISMSIVSMLYNWQLMRLAGQNGVAAYGAVMYVSFVFVAVFLGYSMGTAPIVSYHYGADDRDEVRSLLKKSLIMTVAAGAFLSVLAFVLSDPLARLFCDGGAELLKMTQDAFRYYAISVLFSGVNIFGSAFFTALNNGFVSAAISFLRTFAFQIITVIVLPIFFELNGVWYSLFIAEVLSLFVTAAFLAGNKKKYGY